MKTQRTITIDTDIDAQLKAHPHINVSGITNEVMREYLEQLKAYPNIDISRIVDRFLKKCMEKNTE